MLAKTPKGQGKTVVHILTAMHLDFPKKTVTQVTLILLVYPHRAWPFLLFYDDVFSLDTK